MSRWRSVAWFVAAVALVGCAQSFYTPMLAPGSSPPSLSDTGMLKVHMRNGDLYMLDRWTLVDSGRTLEGHGTHYSAERTATPTDSARVPLDGVALFETNKRDMTFALGLQGIGAFNVLGAFIAVSCLADPKSCFGSCPTFYVEGEDSSRVHAEGFSSSVARTLEARDVDALSNARVRGREVAIHMRNEAQETHLVRRVNLLVAPRPRDGRVFAVGDTAFHAATDVSAPTRCRSETGDCTGDVAALDARERFSLADSGDLAARETIELEFASVPRDAALVITGRNSLVTTFLFYQTLAYFGSRVGEAVAQLERGTRAQAEASFGMARLLGGIEVQVRDNTGWRTVGSYGEAGPIASDTKAVPLGIAPSDRPVTIRLRLAKGNWRIDQVAIARLHDRVEPVRVLPRAVERDGRPATDAFTRLRGGVNHLVTLPGDDYRLRFTLPQPAEESELFLESEGFYYEWMREEWLAEENAAMAALVTMFPAEALRRLAPAYKSREPHMERLFFESRFNPRRSDASNR